MESGSLMQPQLGGGHTVENEQPEPGTTLMNVTPTSEPGNDHQMEDEAANSAMMQDVMPSNINGQGSGSDSSIRSAAVSSHESRMKVNFEFLWRLRKYLLLLAVLAVTVTYNAGLSPPGGFWTDYSLDHHAGDPLLPVRFFQRYEAFFYCNATAFAASLVLIILLLSRGVASKRVWLRSMQITMILDLFSLMGAYAAGTCRALRSSVYILVLVFAVFFYVGIHILVSIRVVPNWLKEQVQKILHQILKKLQGMLNQMLSICHVTDVDEKRNSQNEKQEIEEARKFILMLATFAATITYQAGMSPPGGFWAVNDHGYRPATFVLRRHNLLRFNIFICCNATSFVASLVTVILLLSTELSMHGIRTQALFVCVIVDLLGLIGAYASGCCRDIATSLSVVFIIVVVLICVLILVMFFQSKTVTVWIDKALKPRFDKFLSRLSWPRERQLSNAKQDDSQTLHQQDTEYVNGETEVQGALSNVQCYSADNNLVSTANVKSASANDLNCMESIMSNTLNQSHDQNEQAATETVCSSSTDALTTKEVSTSNMEEQSVGSPQVAIPTGQSSCSDGVKSMQGILPLQGSVDQTAASGDLRIAANDLTMEESSEMQHAVSSADNNLVSTADVKSASASDLNCMESIMSNTLNQSHDQNEQAATETVCSSSTDALTTKEVSTSNMEEQSVGSPQVAIPTGQSSCSDSVKSMQGILPLQGSVDQTAASGDLRIAADDPTMEESSEMQRVVSNSNGDNSEQHAQPMVSHNIGAEDGGEVTLVEIDSASNDQATQHREKSNYYSDKNPGDVRLKKSRTYLLLLAILAVSLTYQAGLNPPGGFWTSNASNHSAGDPILEDNYHKRYLAFFYFNATAFAASLVMIIMLLSRKMSNKVIKRRALQTAMITDLLALMGAFVVGSCRERTKSIYISVVIFFVVAYVSLHVLVSMHVIPERWKEWVAQKLKHVQEESPRTDNDLRDANEKDLERRRNLLFILAILAATVTYQAGLNPPGGNWPDENSKGGKPGNPVLQDSHPKRYDVFYYSNAVSFVSSVSVIILLVNRESCKHGIKSYALRVCLLAGLLGLLTAYSAGSCRKVKPIIYLIVIAAAVLICLVIQVLVLSSTQDALEGPLARLSRWLQKIFRLETDSEILPESSDQSINESNAAGSVPHINEKKERKRHKFLMLLATLAASIAYQAGLNPPGGFWPDDSPNGYKAGNPVLKDIHPRRYMVFFVCNSISFMASIAVVMLLLSKSVRKKKVPLQALNFIMILDLLALMTAYAAGSCRKIRTSIFVFMVVCCVVVYLMIVIILLSGIAKWLKERKGRWLSCWRCPSHVSATRALASERNV